MDQYIHSSSRWASSACLATARSDGSYKLFFHMNKPFCKKLLYIGTFQKHLHTQLVGWFSSGNSVQNSACWEGFLTWRWRGDDVAVTRYRDAPASRGTSFQQKQGSKRTETWFQSILEISSRNLLLYWNLVSVHFGDFANWNLVSGVSRPVTTISHSYIYSSSYLVIYLVLYLFNYLFTSTTS
jgi:hypothetical protein